MKKREKEKRGRREVTHDGKTLSKMSCTALFVPASVNMNIGIAEGIELS